MLLILHYLPDCEGCGEDSPIVALASRPFLSTIYVTPKHRKKSHPR
jgi:hypothetical protein